MPFNDGRGRRRPERIVARTSALAGTALLAAALLAWTPSVATGWNQSSAESTLWQLMNGARVNNGLRPVQQSGTMVSLARWRSKDQVQRNYFDHTVKGTGYQVFHWYDLNGVRYRYGGENIGWNNGYADGDSPVAIHNGFMNSPEHRSNILNGDWTHGGVGAFAADNVSFLGTTRSPRFYTELFYQAVSTASAPPPPSSNPPPPPSSGGGGGSTASAPSAHRASASKTKREASDVRMAQPVRPRASAPLDGSQRIAGSSTRVVAAAKLAALAFADLWQPTGGTSAPVLASVHTTRSAYRVESAASSPAGLVETVLGSLLGGILG
jgi:uncharacterized protein YkwD